MREYWGSRWTNDHGTSPTRLWIKELQTITPQQAALGLQVLKKTGSHYPPSLPEFFKAVETALGKDQFVRPPPFRALPIPPSERTRRTETAKYHIDKLLKKFRKEDGNASSESQTTAPDGHVHDEEGAQKGQEEVPSGQGGA